MRALLCGAFATVTGLRARPQWPGDCGSGARPPEQ